MNRKNTAIVQGVNDLVDGKSPSDWISTIFDMQNRLISSGAMEGFIQAGFENVADDFSQLKNFFVALDNADRK